MNKFINMPKNSRLLTNSEREFARAYLSPNTDGVNTSQVRVPDGTSINTYCHAKQWQVDLTPDAQGNVVILELPFAECPFVRLTTGTVTMTAIVDPNLPQHFMSDNQFYAFRHISQGMTVYNNTAELYRGGSVTAVLLPAFIDMKSFESDDGLVYPRILDGVPTNLSDMTSAVVKPYQGRASDGIYLPNRNIHGWKWRCRSKEWEKARYYPLAGASTVDPSPILNGLGFTTAAAQDPAYVKLPDGTTNVGVTGSEGSGFGVGVVWFSGLHPETKLTLKASHSVEFLPKFSSPLITQCAPSPPRSRLVFEYLDDFLRVAPYAYPAASNGVGEIIRGFFDFLPTAVEKVMSIPKSIVSGMNEVLPVGLENLGYLEQGIGKAGNIMSSFQGLRGNAPSMTSPTTATKPKKKKAGGTPSAATSATTPATYQLVPVARTRKR